MKHATSLFIFALILTGCKDPLVTQTGIKSGDCIQEVNKRYASGDAPKHHIYKVEAVNLEKDLFKVSKFERQSKHYLGYKAPNYFKESSTFRYETVNCPDGSTKAGLTSKIRRVNI